MFEKFSGSAGASILAQVGFVLYLVAGALYPIVTGLFDPFAESGLAVAVLFVVLVWVCWKGRPTAYLASSVVGLLLLLLIPGSFSRAGEPVVIWEASLGATLLVLVVVEGIMAYAATRKNSATA